MRNLPSLIYIVLWFSLLLPTVSRASIDLSNEDFSPFWAGRYLDIVRSDSAAEPAKQFTKQNEFLPKQNKDVPGFGYTRNMYAARLQIYKKSQNDLTIGIIAYGPIEKFYLQQVVNGKLVSSQAEGLQLALATNFPSHSMFRYPHFIVKLSPGLNEFYFGEEAVAQHFPILVLSRSDLQDFIASQNSALAAFSALAFSIVTFSMLSILILRNSTSLIYSIAFICSFLMNSYVTGAFRPILYQIWSQTYFITATQIEQFIYKYWIVWWGLMGFTMILFGLKTLKLRLLDKSASSCFYVIALAASGLLAAWSLFDPVLAVNMFAVFQQIAVILFVIESFRQFRRGHQPAFFLCLGWGAYATATTIQLSYFYGWMPPFMPASWGIVIGSLCQFFCFGAGIIWEKRLADLLVTRMQLERYELNARSERLELELEKSLAISRMTQMLAHDVRRPFSVIKIAMAMLKKVKTGDDIVPLVKRITSEIDRATLAADGLIADVMEAGSTSTNLFKEPVTVQTLVYSAFEEVFRLYPKSEISLRYSFQHTGVADVNVQKFGRVFSNIFGNAIEAMKQRGSIWIETQSVGDQIKVTIGNSNSFIPKENLDRLFTAFFTSGKKTGTGLGLAIAHKVITDHGGTIWCSSEMMNEPPEGRVEFHFTIPCTNASTERPSPCMPQHSSELSEANTLIGPGRPRNL